MDNYLCNKGKRLKVGFFLVTRPVYHDREIGVLGRENCAGPQITGKRENCTAGRCASRAAAVKRAWHVLIMTKSLCDPRTPLLSVIHSSAVRDSQQGVTTPTPGEAASTQGHSERGSGM